MIRFVHIYIVLLILLISKSSFALSPQAYLGSWKFEKGDFRKNHPLLPGFIVNQIMKTRLVLNETQFLQYKNEEKLLYPARTLKLIDFENGIWRFETTLSSGEKKPFSIQHREGQFFYSDDKKTYLIQRDPHFKPTPIEMAKP